MLLTVESIASLAPRTDPVPGATTEQAPDKEPGQAPDQISAGRFSFVGLSELREELGPRWPELRDRVHAVAERCLDRHLLKGDVYDQQDEHTYLVLFAQLSQPQAEFKCRVIAKEIRRRLLGEGPRTLARVETTVTQVPRAELPVRNAEAEPAAVGPTGSPSQAGPSSPDFRALGARNSRDVRVEVQDLPPAEAPPPVVWRSFNSGRRARERDAAPAEPAAPFEPVWRYEPVWDAFDKRLSRYRIADRSGGRSSLQGDLLALRTAFEDALQVKVAGRPLAVVCPLHHASLFEPRGAENYLERVRSLPPPVRRLLTVELLGAREQAWTGRAIQMTEDLRAAGVCIWARTPLDSLDSTPLLHARLDGLIGEPPDAPGTASGCAFRYFARRARSADLSSGLASVATDAMSAEAAASDLRFLSGPAVERDLPSLKDALRFEVLNV